MMIPITRKEKYINEIVGGGNTAPETPQTREELFFADILGEVVAPSPITRIEKYLAKIANKYSGELPEPVTRIERFLARAAGMDISVPTPVTREEMFWADYALIVEKEISGIPPLTFNAIAGTLKNYRIYGNTETLTRSYSGTAPLSFPIVDGVVSNYRVYGNTVNGESVGDLVTDSQSEHYGKYAIPITNNSEAANIYLDEPLRKVGDEAEYVDYAMQKWHRVRKNLLQHTATSTTINGVTFTVNDDKSVTCNNTPPATIQLQLILNMHMDAGKYILSGCPSGGSLQTYELSIFGISKYYSGGVRNRGTPMTFSLPESVDTMNIAILIRPDYTCDNLTFYPMIRKADIEDDTYEPYIENTEVDVTVPALPAQSTSNSLSIVTTVQPSSVVVDVDEIVSCGERTKNLLQSTATSKTLNGVTFTINEDDSITCNGTASGTVDFRLVGVNSYSLPAGNYCLTGAPPTASYSSYYLRAWYSSSGSVTGINDFGRGANFTLTDTMTLLCAIIIPPQQVLNNVTFYPMIRKADIEDDTYEPYGYKIPVTLTADSAETTDIYLDEPLTKSGNNADYIDYATQKRYNSDGTESSVTLPEIAVTAGTNALTVGTEVQPSDVYIKYEGVR